MVVEFLCLIAHAKASNMWSSMLCNDSTTFKTLKSLARLMSLNAGVPMEVHNTV